MARNSRGTSLMPVIMYLTSIAPICGRELPSNLIRVPVPIVRPARALVHDRDPRQWHRLRLKRLGLPHSSCRHGHWREHLVLGSPLLEDIHRGGILPLRDRRSGGHCTQCARLTLFSLLLCGTGCHCCRHGRGLDLHFLGCQGLRFLWANLLCLGLALCLRSSDFPLVDLLNHHRRGCILFLARRGLLFVCAAANDLSCAIVVNRVLRCHH
mmetsp:Transcript_39383/g.99121  ORF Transcript_39383/g.99121 Transcript_39383/m.99121 type:complete len:211 (+) Transcript_39383:172-804(+)